MIGSFWITSSPASWFLRMTARYMNTSAVSAIGKSVTKGWRNWTTPAGLQKPPAEIRRQVPARKNSNSVIKSNVNSTACPGTSKAWKKISVPSSRRSPNLIFIVVHSTTPGQSWISSTLKTWLWIRPSSAGPTSKNSSNLSQVKKTLKNNTYKKMSPYFLRQP